MRSGLNGRTTTTVVAVLIGCWATLAAADDLPDGGTASLTVCDPCTQPNGRGIYVVDNEHYCIDGINDKIPRRFCPEAFIEVPATADTPAHVQLTGRYFSRTQGVWSENTDLNFPNVSVKLENGSLTPLVGASTRDTESQLIFYYKHPHQNLEVGVKEAALRRLVLHVQIPLLGSHLLSFVETAKPTKDSPLYQYIGAWKRDVKAQTLWQPLCTGTNSAMSLLPGKRVDGTSGKVTDHVGATTFSCASGAIVPCMNWGYRPSMLGYTAQQENALLGACIQAKRAAYLGGPDSYTRNGLAINMKDSLPIMNYDPVKDDKIKRLEAIWTEEKAYCLNEHYRRVQPPNAPALPNDWQQKVPACKFDSLPDDWAKHGLIATGTTEEPGTSH